MANQKIANQKIDALGLMDEEAAMAVAAAAAAARPEVTAATRRHAEAARALGLTKQEEVIQQEDKAARARALGFRPMTRPQAVAAMAPGRSIVVDRREIRARHWAVNLLLLLPAVGAASVGVALAADPLFAIMTGALLAVMTIVPWSIARDECGLRFVACYLDDIRDPVPLGVLLRVAELRQLEIFDEFEVVAPAEMTNRPWVGRDPIVLGRTGNYQFFVARWDPGAGASAN